ncbi:hypothetical protein RJ53_09320 [Methanocalculus chunghsingensis]|uniref:Uncharacterized protein n=1 Tax=Methanocalculus chunghsingensis TaxID=156457 RepID=A0A8J7WB23_9EURY|nr:hypothetical protein [Methanocalculus chunghsingensis]
MWQNENTFGLRERDIYSPKRREIHLFHRIGGSIPGGYAREYLLERFLDQYDPSYTDDPSYTSPPGIRILRHPLSGALLLPIPMMGSGSPDLPAAFITGTNTRTLHTAPPYIHHHHS